jgi:hypothetical protein
MGLIERKIAVIDAAAAWAEAIREHGPEAARPFRANFEMALDDALTATDRGAVEERDEAIALLRKAAHRLVPVPPYDEIRAFLDRERGQ